MDENDNKIDETLDRIVRLQEEGKHLTDEEIAQLLQDGDDMRSFKYLQNCKNAVMRHCSPQPLDLDAQWNQLKQKKDKEDKAKPALKSNLFIWGAFTGIAASVLIAFVFVWLHGNFSNSKGYVAFHARKTSVRNAQNE
jgi:hypothetical protein